MLKSIVKALRRNIGGNFCQSKIALRSELHALHIAARVWNERRAGNGIPEVLQRKLTTESCSYQDNTIGTDKKNIAYQELFSHSLESTFFAEPHRSTLAVSHYTNSTEREGKKNTLKNWNSGFRLTPLSTFKIWKDICDLWPKYCTYLLNNARHLANTTGALFWAALPRKQCLQEMQLDSFTLVASVKRGKTFLHFDSQPKAQSLHSCKAVPIFRSKTENVSEQPPAGTRCSRASLEGSGVSQISRLFYN